MRLAWATDIHLNCVDALEQRYRFYRSAAAQSDALLITGDLATSLDLEEKLAELEVFVEKPVYFILGNHDFYRGWIADIRAHVGRIVRASQRLVYLTEARVVSLTADTALVGHDGWADARIGDIEAARATFSDYLSIRDLRQWMNEPWGLTLGHRELREKLHALGSEAAAHLASVLAEAAPSYRRVIVATHIPPFRESAWHDGQACDEKHLPYYTCKAVGDVLLEIAQTHPHCRLLVLVGHSHHAADFAPLPNLHIVTGSAEYGKPAVHRVINVTDYGANDHGSRIL